jgi:hypothetical protein
MQLALFVAGAVVTYFALLHLRGRPSPRRGPTPEEERDLYPDETYFGLYSDNQRAEVEDFLSALGIRFSFLPTEESEERLRAWSAWDESSALTHKGNDLWICFDDLETLGTKFVERFPERGRAVP